MLRLAGRSTSINVRKVIWTLGELGEPFELYDPSLDARGARELMSLNPIALGPVLLDGDRSLWESNTICRYLAGKFERKDLLAEDPADRSEVEKWMDWQATNLNSAWVPCFMARVRRDPTFVANPGVVQDSMKRWNALSLVLDARLAQADIWLWTVSPSLTSSSDYPFIGGVKHPCRDPGLPTLIAISLGSESDPRCSPHWGAANRSEGARVLGAVRRGPTRS